MSQPLWTSSASLPAPSIQASSLDVALNLQRNQIADGLPLLYTIPDVRGRDRYVRQFKKIELRAAFVPLKLFAPIITKQPAHRNGHAAERQRVFAPGPRSYDEMTERENHLELLPGADVQEGVQTKDKIERILRPARFGKIADPAARGRFARARKAPCGEGKAWVLGDRQALHRDTITHRRYGPHSFVRRDAGRNK